MNQEIELISGDQHSDARGIIKFVNRCNLTKAKRFYTIEHTDISVVRAWQGHKIEDKFFHVLKGRFLVAGVKIDNWSKPAEFLIPQEFKLSADKPQVLHIPAGYANGFRALEPNSLVIIFSTLSIDEAPKDDYRYDKNLWLNWFQNEL
jgi:dTDP-4-dehydrorhamnose 3,5-epimerase